MIKIGTNISALQAHRRLSETARAESSAFERLSSGKRINRASDDAAGLSVATSLRATSRILNRGLLNLGDAISYLNVAQGANEAFMNITQRLSELATVGANGSIATSQRLGIQSEANQLVEEFNRILSSTNFSGALIYRDSRDVVRFQGGTGIDGGIAAVLGAGLERTAGTGTFSLSPTTISFGTSSNSDGALVDFNGDGKLDSVVLNNGITVGGIAVRLGNGDGTFSETTFLDTDTGVAGGDLITGDFDGDSITDIVRLHSTNATLFYKGNGDGTFSARLTITASGVDFYSSSRSADINGDGATDIIFGTNTGYSIIFGSRSGNFLHQAVTTGERIADIVVGDINGDGRIDLVTGSNSGARNASVYLNNGSASFSMTQSFAGRGNAGLALSDFDNDGRLELITSNAVGGTPQVMRHNGNGTFTLQRTLNELSGLYIAALADLDGDGLKDDFVTGHTGAYSFYTQDQNGQITLRSSLTVASNGAANGGFSLGDLNGDGITDLLGVTGSNYQQIFLQTTTTATSAMYLDLTTASSSRSALSTLSAQLQRIGAELGNIGSSQSRLGFAINAFRAQALESDAARERIESADIAQESAIAIRSTILKEVGAAVLAQANQVPALALKLLR